MFSEILKLLFYFVEFSFAQGRAKIKFGGVVDGS